MRMFSRCKKAELFDRATGRKVTASVSIGAMDSLMVSLPLDCRPGPDVPVKIVFLDPVQGVVTCRCILRFPLLNDDKQSRSYRCEVLECLSQEQRREDIKVPLTVQTIVTLPGKDRRAPATLRNFSAGGVYLLTSLTAEEGDRLQFDFRETGSVIPLTAEILRVDELPDRSNPFVKGYGCHFIDLPPHHEAQLRSYVFKLERQQNHP